MSNKRKATRKDIEELEPAVRKILQTKIKRKTLWRHAKHYGVLGNQSNANMIRDLLRKGHQFNMGKSPNK